jgi:hypothetical protein
MAISPAPRDYRTLIAAASLIAGPLLMAIGDLLHPEERMAPGGGPAGAAGRAAVPPSVLLGGLQSSRVGINRVARCRVI